VKNVDIYVIDTSALIDLVRWYPMDRQFFKPIWYKIEKLILSNQMIAPYEVFREISGKSDELKKWFHNKKGMFIHPTNNQVVLINQIKDAYDEDYWNRESNKTGAWADPWVIALALYYKESTLISYDVKIITQENKEKPNRIPYVAAIFDIRSFNVLEFLWEIGVR